MNTVCVLVSLSFMNTKVFCDATLCSYVDTHKCSGGSCCLHLLPFNWRQQVSPKCWKCHQSTKCQIMKDFNFNVLQCLNLRPQNILLHYLCSSIHLMYGSEFGLF